MYSEFDFGQKMRDFVVFFILSFLFIVVQAYYPVKKPCRYGYESFDCSEGSCNNKTKECTCPTDRCRLLCRAHYDTDENGCGIKCQCTGEYWELWNDVEKFGCPELRCGMECEEGYELGVGDCPICRCRRPEKRKPCRRGLDEYDCEQGLECNSKTSKCSCLASKCSLKCPRGFSRDSKGCPLCKCLPSNKYLPGIPDGVCPEVRCALKCRYGFAKNIQKCPVCRCFSKEESKKDEEEELAKKEWLKCLQRNGFVKFWHKIKNLFTVEKICGPSRWNKSTLRSARTWDLQKELEKLSAEDYEELQAASFPGPSEAFSEK